ncbi:hypothetical protein EXN61_14540 [Agrobacterium tumefaciens]|uniref:Uncharacterized protein n=1 Tax=Agrobacterium tumefaciens TaxID=358 RepID=A0A546Y061_AGRTU|nr:hypothetical protein EXN61_14540 [Agrobacterium tumefaciens]
MKTKTPGLVPGVFILPEASPHVSSPRGGEGGPKGRMRGQALGLSQPSPPHPAAATFSPLGKKKYAAPARSIFLLTLLSRNGLAAFPLPQMTTQILFDRNQFAFQMNC